MSPVVGPSLSPASGRASLTITVPRAPSAAAAARRRPAYVSPATGSIGIVVSGGARYTSALSASTPGCVPGSAGLVCTVEFPAPLGTDTVFVSTYAGADASGAPLSVAPVTVTVVAGQVNTASVTLSGVVASLELAGAALILNAGTASSAPITLEALDAAGQVIVGPGGYVDANGNPVTIALSDSDTSGATSLSSASVSAPSTAVTLAYNSAKIANFTITASAAGIASATQSITVNVAPQFAYVLQAGLARHPETPLDVYQTLGGGAGIGLGTTSGTIDGGPLGAFVSAGRTGALYTGGGGSQTVLHYAPFPTAGTPPDRTIQSGNLPGGLAADSADGVWMGFGTTLAHFPAGASSADRTITAIAGLPPSYTWNAYAVAVDSHDRVYTIAGPSGSSSWRVYVLPANGSGAVTPLASYPYDRVLNYDRQGSIPVGDVAVDQHDDTIWEFPANVYSDGTALAPTPGATPVAIGLVAYKQNAAASSRALANAGSNNRPYGVAFDDRQNVFVADDTGIVVYDPTQHGVVTTPAQYTAVDGATGIAIPVTSPAPASAAGPPLTSNSAIARSPGAFSFLASGPAYAATLTVSEPNYGGGFTATSTNTAIATAAPGSSANSFTVTPVNAGTTTVRVGDASGGYADVPVTVSITGLTVQGRRR
jgi:hypothetical protein